MVEFFGASSFLHPFLYPLSHLSLMGLISETGFHCLAQDGFNLNPPASTFQDLGLKACAVMCLLSHF